MAKKKVKTITTGQKIILLILLVILVTVLYYFVFYREKANRLKSLRMDYITLSQEEQDWLRRQKTYIQDVEELNRKKERQREQIRILPPEAEMSSFLMDLDNLAGLAGLEIDSLEPKAEQGAGFYAKIPVMMKLTGKFHQLLKFFHSVGKLERIINIENIKVKDVKTSGNDVILTVEVQATTFRSMEKPTVPPVPGS